MDMVGRLNPETKALAIGGFGTSPSWEEKIKKNDKYFKIKLDSSGSGPSDHTSFYRKDIPVLFFFTGTHSDYHKPSDDAEKINLEGEVHIIKYINDLISYYDDKPKLSFLKTREAQMGKSSFKVSLGIFPDYTYSGKGVRVDGVTEGRAAEKAGVKVGDVLLKLGEYEFTDVMSYMGALNKFDKGNATKLILMRNNQTITVDIIF
jgi:C-terminal processing protease CtpA/Prc